MYNKNPKNPVMNHSYDKEEGDYYIFIKKELDKIHISPRDHHFQSFPIKYYIGQMTPKREKLIRFAISDFEEFFPMKEIKIKDQADLKIEIASFDEIKKRYPDIPEEGLSGVGGLERVQTSIKYLPFIRPGKPTRSIVLLTPHAFDQPLISKAIIMHELGHAFGLADHSDDPYDLMYKNTMTKSEIDSNKIIVNGIEQDLEEANSLSIRDLNTLWVLYNQW
ncbi:MAG: hypothetical protein AB1782_04680 [Cyanobacteriota bacterium]